MAEPLVTKEFREDLGTKDPDGLYDYAYRYWEYTFDFGGRRYRARIYVETADDAGVICLDAGRPPEHDDDMQTIAEYLHEDANVQSISAVGPSGAFEPVITFE